MLVSIGDNCIDSYVAPVEQQHVGGNALNVAANFALHGLPAAYAGVVGTDIYGEIVTAALEAIGVNSDYVERGAGSTGVTEVELVHGDYRILKEAYGVSDWVHWTEALRAFVRATASRVHLTVSGQAQQLIEDAGDLEVPLSVDLGTVSEPSILRRHQALLARAESIFISVGAALSDADVSSLLTTALGQGARYAVATRGAVGASSLGQGRLISVPPMLHAAAVVDTVGAGDAFIAGFLSSSALQGHLEERLLCGSRWSAEVCRHIGAWSSERPAAERAGVQRR